MNESLITNDGTTATHIIGVLAAVRSPSDCLDAEDDLIRFLVGMGWPDYCSLSGSSVVFLRFLEECGLELEEELARAPAYPEIDPTHLVDFCRSLAARLMTARQVMATL